MIRRNSDIEIQLPDAGPTPLSPESLSDLDVEMLSEEPTLPLSLPPHCSPVLPQKQQGPPFLRRLISTKLSLLLALS